MAEEEEERRQQGGGLAGLVARQGFAVVDGGLATELERHGADLRGGLWSARLLLEEENAEEGKSGADLIKAVHRAYLEAGADVITTSSYQASVAGLLKRGLSTEDAATVLRRSLQLAHEARSEFWAEEENRRGRERPLVAASIGPYGAYLADGSEYRGDYGATMSQEELMAFHRPRIDMLLSDPTLAPDLFACETLPCLIEAQALVKLFETEHPDQQIWLTFTCKDDTNISNGQPFRDVMPLLDSDVVIGVGINCTAPRYIEPLLEGVRGASTKPFIVYPNSGEGWNSAAHEWTPPASCDKSLDQLAGIWYGLGARVVGGCCRTTPENIQTIRSILQDRTKAA